MPSAIYINVQASGITKFTNCLLAKGNELIKEDLWISSVTGKILNGQQLLYGHRTAPDNIVDLKGRILSPGFIDVQLNGAYGFDFSVIPDDGEAGYGKGVQRVNKGLITTGVTSYLPTLTSQRSEVYHKALPYLAPSGVSRNPSTGSESLGAHCEGPFLNPTKNGIHNTSVLLSPTHGLSSLSACYGSSNLQSPSSIKMITLAPELPGALTAISALKDVGILSSMGHSEATYEEAQEGIAAGATMITHLFNAMRPLHHRNPGMFGLLGTNSPAQFAKSTSASNQNHLLVAKPYFGIIADGIHLHPTSISIAYTAHPSGLILVTDAMPLTGMPDGVYEWTNGSRIVKKGALLTLEENGKIAGSSISLIECVTNFMNWTGAGVAEALRSVTETPARMLGYEGTKGTLAEGGDADLVVLDAVEGRDGKKLVVEQVWKFGVKVFG